jgi:hypothetical protein
LFDEFVHADPSRNFYLSVQGSDLIGMGLFEGEEHFGDQVVVGEQLGLMEGKDINAFVLDLKGLNLGFDFLLVVFDNLLDGLMFCKIIHLKFFEGFWRECEIL